MMLPSETSSIAQGGLAMAQEPTEEEDTEVLSDSFAGLDGNQRCARTLSGFDIRRRLGKGPA